ncbi:MerR family DNA-binding protein [Streptomyces sp. CA-106131]|uniref:MerR family DNA-binding protein n=1 Tax=Streptomyces sp. CA-106131 TaxID=3240045 RepID=UPI003D90FCBE
MAAVCGATAKMNRFYERAGLLPEPPRTAGGYRDYPPEATTRLTFIRDAQSAGLTLAEIRSIVTVRDSGQAPCGHVSELIQQHPAEFERRMAELRKTRIALRDWPIGPPAPTRATAPRSTPAPTSAVRHPGDITPLSASRAQLRLSA